MPDDDDPRARPATRPRSRPRARGRTRPQAAACDATLAPDPRPGWSSAVLLAVARLRRRGPGARHQGRRHLRRLSREDLIQVLNGADRHRPAGRDARSPGSSARRDELLDENRARAGRPRRGRAARRTLNIIAGLVPVSGPGLRVTITEPTSRVSVGSLLDTVQELRTAGAEAMEFNDQIRLVAQTLVRDAVGGIALDGTAARAALRPRRHR